MSLKLVGLALLLSCPCFAGNNSAAEAFATGFANAMNRSMGGREYQAPSYDQQQVNVDVQVTPRVDQHYDAVSGVGTYGGYYFFNRRACEDFLNRSGGVYVECDMVETR